MNFYAKVCFIIAIAALIFMPIVYLNIQHQRENSIQMDFEIIESKTIYISRDRRTIGSVRLKGKHPNNNQIIETDAIVDVADIKQYPKGKIIPGLYYSYEDEAYAHIGPAMRVNASSAIPLFGVFALFFGILGFIIWKKTQVKMP